MQLSQRKITPGIVIFVLAKPACRERGREFVATQAPAVVVLHLSRCPTLVFLLRELQIFAVQSPHLSIGL